MAEAKKMLRPQLWEIITFTIIGKKRLKFRKLLQLSLKKQEPLQYL